MDDTQGPRAATEAGAYSRPYERDKVDSGRRFVSLDIDADVLSRVDDIRTRDGVRRGIAIERLLRSALAIEQREPVMT